MRRAGLSNVYTVPLKVSLLCILAMEDSIHDKSCNHMISVSFCSFLRYESWSGLVSRLTLNAGRQLSLALSGFVSYDLHHTRPWKTKNIANCELQMLSGVTLNCQVTMIVMNTSSQLKQFHTSSQVSRVAL